jgi:hypothetical protein
VNAVLRERTNVFNNAFGDGDCETAIAPDIERAPSRVTCTASFTVEHDRALARNYVHLFGLVGSEVVTARVNKAERLLGLIIEENAMTDDFAIKIDIGLRYD